MEHVTFQKHFKSFSKALEAFDTHFITKIMQNVYQVLCEDLGTVKLLNDIWVDSAYFWHIRFVAIAI